MKKTSIFAVLAVQLSVSMAFAAGAGISQSQSGSVFQTQVGPGLNTQAYVAGGVQGYGAVLGASNTNIGFFHSNTSGVMGVAGAIQGTVISGQQAQIGFGHAQFGTYNNNQGASVYAY